MVINISNLEHNSSLNELDTLKQEQVKGGFFVNKVIEGNVTSFLDRFTVSLNGETIPVLDGKPFNLNFVLTRKNKNVSTDSENQVLKSGNAQVIIGGKTY